MSNVRWAARDIALDESDVARTEGATAWSTSLGAIYETEPDAIAEVLPKPLTPSQPTVRISISQVEMENGNRFGAAWFGVRARHGDVEGSYALTMPMSSEAAVIGGREMYGEPKKLADVVVERDGDRVRGAVTRYGITYIELRGEVTGELDPYDEQKVDFYFKFLIAPDARGFDDDPSLVHCTKEAVIRRAENVTGEVILRDSPVDPVADFPVLKLISMNATERRTRQSGRIVERVPAEWIVPFVHQRYDRFEWRK